MCTIFGGAGDVGAEQGGEGGFVELARGEAKDHLRGILFRGSEVIAIHFEEQHIPTSLTRTPGGTPSECGSLSGLKKGAIVRLSGARNTPKRC